MTWPQHQRGQCQVDGHVVELGRRLADILSTLLARSPHIVPTEDLIEEVWPDPDTQPLTARHILSRCAADLRRLVGRTHIRTLYRWGYSVVQAPSLMDKLSRPSPKVPLTEEESTEQERQRQAEEGSN